MTRTRFPRKPSGTAFYRGRCLECHSSGSPCRLPEPERRQKSRDDSCIECHMPRSSLKNIAHTAETNHGIPRYPDADSQPPVIASSRKYAEVPLVASVLTRAGMESDPTLESRFDRELGIALAGFGAESHSDRARLARIAMPMLDAALKRHPDDLVAWQSKVVAFTLRGQNKEAFEAARSAIALAPNDERTLALSFPFVVAEAGAYEAIAVGKRLLSINPHVSKYQLLMAQLLARNGRWSEAVDACREALRIDPLNLTARHILIKSALEMKDFATARTEADIYLRFELNPADRRAILKSLETAR